MDFLVTSGNANELSLWYEYPADGQELLHIFSQQITNPKISTWDCI